MKDSETKIILKRIADHLLLHCSPLDNLGLFHGKMGVVIFLYHYSRYNKSEIYKQLADDILAEIIYELHDKLPIDLANGYCGIGWSITYLLKINFIEGDLREVLEDIDNKIMGRDVFRITDYQLFTGLEGILHYIIYRLSLHENKKPFDKKYMGGIFDLSEELIRREQNKNVSELASQCLLWNSGKSVYYNPNTLIESLFTQNQIDKITELNLGIENGCAGIGLNIIFNEKKSLHI